MVRRGQQDRREVQRAQRAADAALGDQEHGEYRRPPRQDCAEKTWFSSVDDADTIRVEPHIWKMDGRPVDFSIIVKVPELDGTWVEIARVDCCHGHVHLHHQDGSETSIAPLHSVEDVESNLPVALEAAEAYATTIRDVREKHV